MEDSFLSLRTIALWRVCVANNGRETLDRCSFYSLRTSARLIRCGKIITLNHLKTIIYSHRGIHVYYI